MEIISRLQHINEIYTETGKRVLKFTPQLFTFKDVEAKAIQAHASCVLLKAGNSFYLLTAMHCVRQGNKSAKIGVFDRDNKMKLLSGPMTLMDGPNSETDLAIVKLDEQSVEILSGHYAFLDAAKLRPTSNLAIETEYLITGHPISRTKIDNKKMQKESEPLIYISRSASADKYERLWLKNDMTQEKYQLNINSNFLLHFNKRRSTIAGSDEMSMAPQPKGISGCGIWYIQSYEIRDPREADFYLTGIIIEYENVKGYLIGTRSEKIALLLQSSIANWGN